MAMVLSAGYHLKWKRKWSTPYILYAMYATVHTYAMRILITIIPIQHTKAGSFPWLLSCINTLINWFTYIIFLDANNKAKQTGISPLV